MIYLKNFENSNINDIEINLANFVIYLGDMYKAVDLLIELSKNCKKYKSLATEKTNPIIQHGEDIDDEYSNDPKDSQSITINYNRSVSYGFIKSRPDYFWNFYFYNVDMNKISIETKIYLDTLKFNI